ncbi:hypothetical protein K469DRAFT_702484 [Zopfia rhizophila CBS 207.26]|uniref:Uncharacterized protein n=1 Tax=Zopfia rhizophila CBS 207.26 TaxID=1314779 RepID=A0A6A6EA94_9PEZI|nr:hypothetical protein K469DRAFT_702484 [Zopfia rhizophila CBS 207.26]
MDKNLGRPSVMCLETIAPGCLKRQPSPNDRPEYSDVEDTQNPKKQGPPKYSDDQRIAILYLHIMLEMQWDKALKVFKTKYPGERTVQGLQSEAYRYMDEWNMVKARQESSHTRKKKNKTIFRKKIAEKKKNDLLKELEKAFGSAKTT